MPLAAPTEAPSCLTDLTLLYAWGHFLLSALFIFFKSISDPADLCLDPFLQV